MFSHFDSFDGLFFIGVAAIIILIYLSIIITTHNGDKIDLYEKIHKKQNEMVSLLLDIRDGTKKFDKKSIAEEAKSDLTDPIPPKLRQTIHHKGSQRIDNSIPLKPDTIPPGGY